MMIIKNTRSPPVSFRIPKRKAEKLETHVAFRSSESKKPKVEGAAGVKKSHDYDSWYDELEDFISLPEWDEVDESSSSSSQVVSTTTTDETEAEASKQDENSPIEASRETTDESHHQSDSTLLNEVEETKEDAVSKPEEKKNNPIEEEAPKTTNQNPWSDSPPLDYKDALWLDPLVALPVCDDAVGIDYSSRGTWDLELSKYQKEELLGFPDATRSFVALGQSEETCELSEYLNDELLGFPSETRTCTGLGQSGVARVTSFEELMSSAAGEVGCTSSSIPSQPGKDQTDNEVVLIDSLGSKTYQLKRNHDVIIID